MSSELERLREPSSTGNPLLWLALGALSFTERLEELLDETAASNGEPASEDGLYAILGLFAVGDLIRSSMTAAAAAAAAARPDAQVERTTAFSSVGSLLR